MVIFFTSQLVSIFVVVLDFIVFLDNILYILTLDLILYSNKQYYGLDGNEVKYSQQRIILINGYINKLNFLINSSKLPTIEYLTDIYLFC